MPADQVTEMGNHATLLDLDLDLDFGGKSKAYLVKAVGGGYPGKNAVIRYSAEVNPIATLKDTFQKLGVTRASCC